MPGCGGNCACAGGAPPPLIVKETAPMNTTVEDEKLANLLNTYFSTDVPQDEVDLQQKEIFKRYKDVYRENTLVRIVETLGFALTDTVVEKRAKGTGLLAECIFQCLPGSLDELEVSKFFGFLVRLVWIVFETTL